MFEKRDIFKEFTKAEAIRKQEERERLREATLEQRRRTENAAIIQATGEGCSACIDGAKSDSTCEQIDICRAGITPTSRSTWTSITSGQAGVRVSNVTGTG